jgi:hypothetical protein
MLKFCTPFRLETLYEKLANIALSLSTPSLSRIRSLGKNDNSTWEVLYRPLLYSMNETVQLETLPRSKLPLMDVLADGFRR